MKIVCIGGGPAGLYLGILMKKADPGHQIRIFERNQRGDTFGFGVVFSDETLDNLRAADPETFARITESFSHWDDIDVHYKGELLRSSGHGFSGLSRRKLLQILEARCSELGVEIVHESEIDGVEGFEDADLIVAADGVNSTIRARYAAHFKPTVDWRPNRFIWLGTTLRFPAFTFYFNENEHGLWRVHAYNYDDLHSTFIIECTEETWQRSGMDKASEDESVAYCEALFAKELEGHGLIKNRSIWRSFPTVSNEKWYFDNVVLLGDAVHTAHFSIGSGTKLAMEDAISLRNALVSHEEVGAALKAYQAERKPAVESLQRAAQVSLEWFENTERYFGTLSPEQFTFSLLTRSLRITHSKLALRDAPFVARIDRSVAEAAGLPAKGSTPVPPMFTPFRLRGLTLANRVMVSPMCQYSAEDGTPNDWHLVHLGSRAVGGAGLLMCEMTDVSREARISPGCTGLYKPEHVPAWKRIVDFVHTHGDTKIGMQLAHAGRKGSTRRMWEGIDEPLTEGNWPLLSASAIPYLPQSQVPMAMDRAAMDEVLEAFVRSAGMANEAGFDLLELHFAHGYLLASFLSPLTNIRDDEYGGSLEKRWRYPMEVFDAVRAVWPEDKPMSVRISATDWEEGGSDGDDAVELARVLKAHGCDILDVSTGQTTPNARPRYGRLYQTPFSERIRLEAEIPTITVGNISSYADVNSVIAAGRADLCAIARGHLFDPYWTRHAAFEQRHPMPPPPQYVSVGEPYTPRFEWSPRGNE